MAKGKTIQIQWVKSTIGAKPKQREAVRSLGLRRLGQVVVRTDSPAVRGLVAQAPHLVRIVSR